MCYSLRCVFKQKPFQFYQLYLKINPCTWEGGEILDGNDCVFYKSLRLFEQDTVSEIYWCINMLWLN